MTIRKTAKQLAAERTAQLIQNRIRCDLALLALGSIAFGVAVTLFVRLLWPITSHEQINSRALELIILLLVASCVGVVTGISSVGRDIKKLIAHIRENCANGDAD